jgi:hypothetical protein
MPLLVSFHTPDYRIPADHLSRSCAEQGVRLYSIEKSSAGTWKANCAMKGPFVFECLKEFKTPIVWVDSDAQVLAMPSLFTEIDCDFAAYWPEGRRTLLSGTLFFNFTDKALRLASLWAKRCEHADAWDQRLLTEEWRGVPRDSRAKFRRLPQGYCKIWDARWREGEEKKDVIVHYQYSRDVKDRRRGSGYRK